MNDLDGRLAARFAQIEPSAGVDARLAARLAAERQREARHDRAAELQAALRPRRFVRTLTRR